MSAVQWCGAGQKATTGDGHPFGIVYSAKQCQSIHVDEDKVDCYHDVVDHDSDQAIVDTALVRRPMAGDDPPFSLGMSLPSNMLVF